MRRFITGPGQAGDPSVTLTGEEARHIGRVLRMQPGEQVMLLEDVYKRQRTARR